MTRFFKYHALGNDYLVLEPQDCPELYGPKAIRAICHRHYGLGSDGILYGPLPSENADFGLQIWNPDGTPAEKSGNGLRIFAKHLLATQRLDQPTFTIEVPGGVVHCEILDDGKSIRVEMGQVSFDAERIPVRGESGDVINREIVIDGERLTYCAATIGNPHVVVPLPEVSPALAKRFGPLLENAIGHFPNRTNVQLLKAINEDTIQIEIWERGAGYTLASGSSSSAAAAVAHKLGMCGSEVTVCCPGGNIGIQIGEDYQITMTGPATYVGTFQMDPGIPIQRVPKD